MIALMRLVPAQGVIVLGALGLGLGCGQTTDDLPQGAGGMAATGGAPSSGGTGSGGTGGGRLSEPVGSVRLELELDPAESYCDTQVNCQAPVRIEIRTLDGSRVGPQVYDCAVPSCDSCGGGGCPLIDCPSGGVSVSEVALDWDGLAYDYRTCQGDQKCSVPTYLPAGEYVAHMCAVPGDLIIPPDEGEPYCAPSGPEECVSVSFDFPGDALVVGQLD